MRRVLILILCLLMPLHSFAALQVAMAPCPMQGMMATEVKASDLGKVIQDCCNDLAALERTGQPCKSAQSCVAPAAGLPSFPPMVVQTPVTQDSQAPVWCDLPPGAASRLWRPPTPV